MKLKGKDNKKRDSASTQYVRKGNNSSSLKTLKLVTSTNDCVHINWMSARKCK